MNRFMTAVVQMKLISEALDDYDNIDDIADDLKQ